MDRRAGGDLKALELEVVERLAGHPGDRGGDAHDLLDRGLAEIGVGAQERPLVGVVREGLHRQAQLVARGVEAAEDHERHRVAQLGRREPLVVALRLHERGGEVVAGLRRAVGDHRVAVGEELGQRRLDLRQLLLERDAHRQADGGRQARDLRPVLLRQTEQDRDDAGGVRLGELRDVLALAGGREPVDQLVRQRDEARREGGEGTRREGRVEQAAQAGVVLALHVEQPARPPLCERPGHAVVRGPGPAALAQAAVLDEPVDLVVAEHGEAVRRPRAPTLGTGLTDGVGLDRERRVRDGEVRELVPRQRGCRRDGDGGHALKH